MKVGITNSPNTWRLLPATMPPKWPVLLTSIVCWHYRRKRGSMKYFFLLLLISFAFISVAVSQEAKKPNSHQDLAIAAFKKNNFSEAAKHFENAYDFEISQPEPNLGSILGAKVWAGMSYSRMNEGNKAISSYKVALEYLQEVGGQDSETAAQIHEKIGIELNRKNELVTSIQHQSKALKIYRHAKEYPNQAFIMSRIGNSFIQLGEYDNAKQIFDQLVEIDEKLTIEQKQLFNIEYSLFFANIYIIERKYSQASSVLNKKIVEKYKHPLAYGLYGQLLLSERKIFEARNAMAEASARLGKRPQWSMGQGHVSLLNKNPETAKVFYEEAISLIKTEEQFLDAVGDFEMFIKKGWEVDSSRSLLQWFKKNFQKRKELLTSAIANKDMLKKQLELLEQQALEAYQQRDYQKGILLAQKAYNFALENFGESSLDTLSNLTSLGAMYREAGDFKKAVNLLGKAYKTIVLIMGQSHPAIIPNQINLAQAYELLGSTKESIELYEKAYWLSKKENGDFHSLTINSLIRLSFLYQSPEKFEKIEPHFKKIYQFTKQKLGESHPTTLNSVNNLAFIYKSQFKYKIAEQLYYETYEVMKNKLGNKHPNTLIVQNSLAEIYVDQGRYGEAETLLKQVYESRREVLGEADMDTLRSLSLLGVLYETQDRFDDAEPLYIKAYNVSRNEYGEKNGNTLRALNNLAVLYYRQGRYEKAEPLLLKVIPLMKDNLGEKHLDTLSAINNLGEMYRRQQRLKEAEPLLEKSYENSIDVLGEGHPSSLTSFSNLALLYYAQGKKLEAERMLESTYSLQAKTLGLDNPDTLKTQINLIWVLAAQNKIKKAHQHLKIIEPKLYTWSLSQLLTIQKSWLRRKFLLSLADFQDAVITLAIQSKDPDIQVLAGSVLSGWKQIESDLDTRVAKLVHASKDGQLSFLWSKVQKLRSDIAFVANSSEQKIGESLDKKLQQLEIAEIQLRKYFFKSAQDLEDNKLNIKTLQEELPPNTTFIEFKPYIIADFEKGEGKGGRRWAILIVPSIDQNKPINIIDGGLISETIRLFEDWAKDDFVTTENKVSPLYDYLFGELDDQLESYDTIFISPEGVLSITPFESLKLPDGRYWLERQQLHFVQTGRDLLPVRSRSKTTGLLALGNIEYNHFGKISTTSDPAEVITQPSKEHTLGMLNRWFKHLESSKNEVERIVGMYDLARQGPTVKLTNRDATENKLKRIKSPPEILHLATHGFFSPQLKRNDIPDYWVGEQPMVLSGLSLTGANQGLMGNRNSDGDDGILYSLEVLGLNLLGTKLVSLSACETGQGIFDYSEGGQGLVKAFRVAGAQSVLMTLRPVNDKNAKDFMLTFYNKWLSAPSKHPSQAIRETKLAFLQSPDPNLRNPKLWSPYILIGRNN